MIKEKLSIFLEQTVTMINSSYGTSMKLYDLYRIRIKNSNLTMLSSNMLCLGPNY